MPKDYTVISLDELALHAGQPPHSWDTQRVELEFMRRQTKAQVEAAEGSKEASQAAVDTAAYTKKMVRWMAISVFVQAGAAILAAAVTVFRW